MSVIDEYMERSSIFVKDMKEHEDGSATLEIETDEKTKAMLIQAGLISILMKAMDAEDSEYEIEDNPPLDNNKTEE